MIYQGFLFPRPATWPAYQKLGRWMGMGCGRKKGEGRIFVWLSEVPYEKEVDKMSS